MSDIKTHKDLEVWQKAIDLVEKTYCITKTFPHDELYGLTSQIRRAAVSIPSNIAEGAARQTNKEYIQYLYVALGSLSELETQFIVAKRTGTLHDDNGVFPDIEHLRRKLLNFIKYRKNKLSGK
jgi:four helix bundle protein